MTLLVVALDALDSALVDEFDADRLRLETSGRMETVSHMREQPYTPEAWASAATGMHPSDHGVSGGTSKWSNPLVDFASRFTGHLSMSMRSNLGNLIEGATGAEYTIAEVDSPTMFDGKDRIVHNWPGVSNGEELKRAWDIMWREGQTNAEFERDILGLAAEQFGWVREMLQHDVSVAGVHVHLLDATGHAYTEDRDRLRTAYERAGEFVGELCKRLDPSDDLLLVSDHGMTVDFYSDEHDHASGSGAHSWRAYAASTTDSVPDTILDVKSWVNEHAPQVESEDERLDIDEQRLRDLGYI
ncbi:alkaline phosphatase family protein [Haloterrigena salifodinae]|uniref:alkaline phosphatase family protein n=1 Tax=Haloterrigena salifodinae TaxID=2675099 RepID=UPI000F87761B|nr:alkaline phosphatase family protein [Haloterrigena salifodinae]